MQTISAVFGGEIHQLSLPDPDEDVMKGIRWGAFDQLFTPAYWSSQLWMLSEDQHALTYKLGTCALRPTMRCANVVCFRKAW
jgi:hypothetical protein